VVAAEGWMAAPAWSGAASVRRGVRHATRVGLVGRMPRWGIGQMQRCRVGWMPQWGMGRMLYVHIPQRMLPQDCCTGHRKGPSLTSWLA
jgi:hypothetical protein